MTKLTTERKAELFDYLASRMTEFKVETDFGGSDWYYPGQCGSEELAELVEEVKKSEQETDD